MNKLILFLMILLTIITAPLLVRPTPIPRLIHYVWVGRNPLPNSAQAAIASWKKYAPGYRIKNEVAFYPATVALINLGGPETIGVHGYDATWVKGAQGGEWHSVVYRDFIKHIAIKIIENQKTDYLIPYRHPYVYRLSDKKQGRIIRQLPDTVTVKYTDGLIRTYPLKR